LNITVLNNATRAGDKDKEDSWAYLILWLEASKDILLPEAHYPGHVPRARLVVARQHHGLQPSHAPQKGDHPGSGGSDAVLEKEEANLQKHRKENSEDM
jgi:hypothetical protein